MGWLRLVRSIELQVSFAEEAYKIDDILQKKTYNFKEPTNRSHPMHLYLYTYKHVQRMGACIRGVSKQKYHCVLAVRRCRRSISLSCTPIHLFILEYMTQGIRVFRLLAVVGIAPFF